MKDVFITRFMLLKKNKISLIIWLLAPIAVTIAFLATANTVEDDFTVPVGLVLEEETNSALELYEEMKESPLVTVSLLSEHDAIRQVEQHELDSVFIVKQGYEQAIESGDRRNILESYYSDRSFAYNSVKEMIVSIIQQETGRVKAANTVMALEKELSGSQKWSKTEIITKSNQIQAEEDLLNNEFRYLGDKFSSSNSGIEWNPWMIWAFAAMLFTLFLFDWVIKERNAIVGIRFYFAKIKFSNYMLYSLSFYILLLFIIDLLTAAAFYLLYQNSINLITLLSYRITICLFSFLLVCLIRKTYVSYVLAIALTLTLVVLSGALLPFGGIGVTKEWLNLLNPLSRFLSGEWTMEWLGLCLTGVLIWYVWEEKKYA
ncbi:ABC-2 type transport system permease protein [Gracilibacillus ureilyticus]|uniref:ABC-2 type transport system permease protein n=1 Tax=Gracilibacillus ureilyticus TaxID=531814 RepID=A0A1H9MUX8_9BACI|nr:ABC transporter permease [Gracilibacillus ureilyticus]SER27215.1 ABC-2 type transport system permease protein [Gracilibacillus ureilyticus]